MAADPASVFCSNSSWWKGGRSVGGGGASRRAPHPTPAPAPPPPLPTHLARRRLRLLHQRRHARPGFIRRAAQGERAVGVAARAHEKQAPPRPPPRPARQQGARGIHHAQAGAVDVDGALDGARWGGRSGSAPSRGPRRAPRPQPAYLTPVDVAIAVDGGGDGRHGPRRGGGVGMRHAVETECAPLAATRRPGPGSSAGAPPALTPPPVSRHRDVSKH